MLSKEELYKEKTFYSELTPRLEKFAKSKINLKKLQKEIGVCFDKNSYILQNNLIGRQLLINRKTESIILEILGTSHEELNDLYRSSQYFQAFEQLQLKDQILFAIPLILLSGVLLKERELENARFIYFFAFFKPYASIVSKFFPYGINEDRMRYTVEVSLTDKSDIRKTDTVSNMLLKKAEVSLENYKKELLGETTNRELHVIFASGIQSRINNSILKIKAEYEKNKDKYLPFEASSFLGGDEEGGPEFSERNIMSDTAVKTAISRKAVSRLNSGQIDTKAINIACQIGFGTTSPRYEVLMKNLLSEIIDKMNGKFQEFFDSLLGSILFHQNPETKKKYTGKDLQSPVFLTAALGIFKKKNTKDKNTLRTKELINEMLENCSDEYLIAGETKKGQLRIALYFYFVLICRLDG